MQVRFGFENVEDNFKKYFNFLNDHGFSEFQKKESGSFIEIVMTNGKLNFMLYFEYIEEILIISILEIGKTTATTTFQMNKLMHLGYDETNLKPEGADYQKAFELNAEVIKKYLDANS